MLRKERRVRGKARRISLDPQVSLCLLAKHTWQHPRALSFDMLIKAFHECVGKYMICFFFFFNQTFMKIAPASKTGFHFKKSYKACTAFILSELTFYLHIIGFVNDRFPRKKA